MGVGVEGGGGRSLLQDVMMCAVLSVSEFGSFTGPSRIVTVNVTTTIYKHKMMYHIC